MTLLGVLLIAVIWYMLMGVICTVEAARNGSLRATQQEEYDGHQFSMTGIVLFVFVFWPIVIIQNWRHPERFEEFSDDNKS